MTRFTARRAVGVLLTAIAACTASSGALALSSRVWVSAAKGSDAANCGAPASPCRTLQYAHDNAVAAGGEIDVLDPGGYGSVVISKALTIANDGVGLVGVQRSGAGAAIRVNAAFSDKITLRGLNVEGLGVATFGVVVDAAKAVTIDHCVIQHFVGSGVRVQQSANEIELYISNSSVSENPGDGVNVSLTSTASASGVFSNSLFLDNAQMGVTLDNFGPNTKSKFVIVDSTSSGNGGSGFRVTNATLNLDHVVSSHNSSGATTASTGLIRLTRSTVTDNSIALNIEVGTKIESFGDNVIRDNQTDVSGPGSFTFTPLR